LAQFEKELLQKEENKTNVVIVKYFIRTLSMYDSEQIGIDQRVAWDNLVRAKEMHTKVLKPLENPLHFAKELSRLQWI
jgi:hypothetical protein